MAGDPLIIGTSGLLAMQRALAATSHNISNVNTEGFSRQRVDLASRPPTTSGVGTVGAGVQVNDVARIFDAFINARIQNDAASHSQFEAFTGIANQVDGLLADPGTGVVPAMEAFFNAVQGVADDPTSTPAREVMLSEAATLISRFNFFDDRLETMQD